MNVLAVSIFFTLIPTQVTLHKNRSMSLFDTTRDSSKTSTSKSVFVNIHIYIEN